MEKAASIARKTLPVLFGLLLAGGCARMTRTTPNPSAAPKTRNLAEVSAVLESGGRFRTEQIVAYRQDAGLVPALIESVPGRPPTFRREAVELLVELGRGQYQPEAGWPLWPTPGISDLRVVGCLATLLGDTDRAVRDAAARALITAASDLAIRSFNAEVVLGLERYPQTSDAALLLGKTGAAHAVELLRSLPTLRDANPEHAQLALARLGDRTAEAEIVARYSSAKRPSELKQRAWQLGYLATPLAVIALARDLRNPGTYIWSGSARRSIRVDIIEALHVAFPAEPIFFSPPVPPEGDAYYATIEEWISHNLGVTWTAPRPPFLYQEQSPILP